MKKSLLILILSAASLTSFVVPEIAFANHVNSKSFVFHWVNKTTVEMRDTVQGTTTQFVTTSDADQDASFLGAVDFSKYQDCPDKRGIQFSLDKDVYKSVDTAKPTIIKSGNYGTVGNGTCSISNALVDQLREGKTGIGFITDPANGTVTDTNSFTSGATQQNKDESCENGEGAMRWIMCPVIVMVAGAINWVDSRVVELLRIDKGYYENPGIKNATANIRNIAYTILIPIMLIMVLSTALGFEFISAYTVKKAFPRLFIAVIFIAVSYPFCVFMIEVTDTIGKGTMGLITSPFGSEVSNLTLTSLFGGSLMGTAFGSLGLAAAAYILIAFFFLVPLLTFALTALGILLLRQILIVALLLVAPLAILAWIFPGNDKLWKAWWSSFSKLLLMYPIIMGLFAVGHIFAWIIHADSDKSGVENTLNVFMILFAWMVPYALITTVFKFAGGVLATATGKADGLRQSGAKRRAEKRRQKVGDKWNAIQEQRAIKGGIEAKEELRDDEGNIIQHAQNENYRQKFNRALQATSMLGAGGVPFTRGPDGQSRKDKFKSNMNTAINMRNMALAAKTLQENETFKAMVGDDDFHKARLEGGANFEKFRASLLKHGGGRFFEANADGTLSNRLIAGKEEEIKDLFNLSRRMDREVGGAVAAFADGRALSTSSTAWKNTRVARTLKNADGTDVVDDYGEVQHEKDSDGKVIYDVIQDAQGKMAQTINRLAGRDRTVKTRLLAEFRDNQVRAGRTDMGAASFSDMSVAVDKLYASDLKGDNSYTLQNASNDIIRSLVKGKGFYQLMGEKGENAVSIAPVLAEMAKESLLKGEEDAGVAMTQVAAALSSMGSMSLEMRDRLSKTFTGATVDLATEVNPQVRANLGLASSGKITLADILEKTRTDESSVGKAFRKAYYEYSYRPGMDVESQVRLMVQGGMEEQAARQQVAQMEEARRREEEERRRQQGGPGGF